MGTIVKDTCEGQLTHLAQTDDMMKFPLRSMDRTTSSKGQMFLARAGHLLYSL